MNLTAFLFSAVAFAATIVWFIYLIQTLISVRRRVGHGHNEAGMRSQALLHRYYTLEPDSVRDTLMRGVAEDAQRTEAGSDGEIQHEAEGTRPSASADV